MEFVSLGMIIIDDIYPEASPPLHDVLGGAGTFATVGARVFCSGEASAKVGYMLHAGSDLSQALRREVSTWKSGTYIVETPDRLTTRGMNRYANGIRHFRFKAPKIQVEPSMLKATYLIAKSYHLICTPARCIMLVKKLLQRRERILASLPSASEKLPAKPIFVWEPMENSCRPDQRKFFYEALKYVDVFSPNQDEMQALFADQPDHTKGYEESHQYPVATDIDISPFSMYLQLKARGFGDKRCALILRQGAKGCTVCSGNSQLRIPAYHQAFTDLQQEERDSWVDKVVDVTGGGNAFLGGFCVGIGQASMWREAVADIGINDFEAAAFYGVVSASFAIEQYGMPKLTYRSSDGAELWNGERPHDRLVTVLCRVAEHVGIDTRPTFSSKTIETLLEKYRSERPLPVTPFDASKSTQDESQRSESDAHGPDKLPDIFKSAQNENQPSQSDAKVPDAFHLGADEEKELEKLLDASMPANFGEQPRQDKTEECNAWLAKVEHKAQVLRERAMAFKSVSINSLW